ncbi:MAG: hypothetical protein WBD16_11500 [Pyrinomonadaceae bacterium]
MEDKLESKPPFWSSLPGIFTGIGGVLVALTGLITALVSTGWIGPKANSNAVPPPNTAVTLVSAPAAAASPNAEHDRYKHLTGKWEVIEERSRELGGAKIIWQFNAAVSGNELTLTGKMHSFNGKDLSPEQKGIRSKYVTTLMGSTGMGEFKKTEKGVTMSYPATIRFEDDQSTLHGTIDIKGQQACSLTGRKLVD